MRPANAEFLRDFQIEAFNGDRHDRDAFSCGKSRYDNFLKISATKFVKEGDGRIYVAVERGTAQVIGFYAIAPHAIHVSSLEEKDRKRLPHHDRIAAFLLAMLAVDERVQGRGLGRLLLADMFHKCLVAAELVGGRFIVLDADDARAKALYARLGFQALASDPARMIIAIKTLRNNAAAAVRAGEGE